MNGPDALAGVRRGVRRQLSGARTEAAASADQDAAPGTSTGPDFPAARGSASRGTGSRGRRTRPDSRAERDAGRPARLSLSNWPVSTRLAAVFIVASVTGLVFGGLRIANAASEANAYSRTAQLATLAEQATALAQAMENERDLYAGFAAHRTLAAAAAANKAGPAVAGAITAARASENAALTPAQQATDAVAARTSSLASAIGAAFPASIQSRAADVSGMIGATPGLLSELTGPPMSGVLATYP